jgi:hypothetical protein
LLIRDVWYAVRALRRNPLFTAVVAITIPLGIGASTALFSVAHAVLLRPLPYPDPDRLVVMYMDLRARNNFAMPFSYENFTDIRKGSSRAIEDMATVRTSRLVIPDADGTPEQVALGFVTTNFFQVMGARIAHGRDLLATLSRDVISRRRTCAPADDPISISAAATEQIPGHRSPRFATRRRAVVPVPGAAVYE